MQIINDDPLKKQARVNWKTAVKNPYISKISTSERIKMVIDALYEDCNMTKEQFKKEVDLILA